MLKKIWGPSIWNLFHCMSYNLISDKYDDIQKAINIIVTICYNLPCPICSQHAKVHLAKYSLHKIDTRNKLKQFVYIFHNTINKDLHKPEFPQDGLVMYETMDFNTILNQFFYVIKNIRTAGLTLYSFHRDDIIIRLRNYFIENRTIYLLD